VDCTQYGGLVEDQTILNEKSKQHLHWNTLLVGASYHTTNRQQLLVLQQYQGFICQGQALRGSYEVGRYFVLLNQPSNQLPEIHGGFMPAFCFSISSRPATSYQYKSSSMVTLASP